MASLTRSQTVLKLDGVKDRPRFVQEGEPSERRTHEYRMDRQVWDDMGQPNEITLTIEPGDTLNESRQDN